MNTQERIEKQLKPCPFCGADDGHGVCVRCLWPYETYEVFCENCGASSKEFILKDHAIEAWNRRVKEQ